MNALRPARVGRRGGAILLCLSMPAVVTSLPPPAGAGSSASAFPTSGSDIRLSDPRQDHGTCNIQSEAALARSGSNLVAAWNDSAACLDAVERYMAPELDLKGPDLSASGYAWSNDGGESWHDAGTISPRPGWYLFGDPVLAAGPDGTFYYASNAGGPTGRTTITVSRSTDGGRSFSLPVDVAPALPRGPLRDKPWIAVDATDSPYRGTLYVAFTEWTGSEECGETLWLTRSTDGGRTFAPPIKLECTLGGAFGVQLGVGPDGEVYASWLGGRFVLMFARSVDGGRTFSLPAPIADWPTLPGTVQPACVGWDGLARLARALVFDGERPRVPVVDYDPMRVLAGDIRVDPIPSMAVDVYGSSDPDAPDYNPYRGHIYIALTARSDDRDDVNAQSGLADLADVAFLRSADGGATWGPLNIRGELDWFFDDDDTETDQFQPQVAVGPDGTVAVSWYDRRGSGFLPNGQERNFEIDVVAAFSTDGGETFTTEDPLVVTDEPFPPSRTSPNTGMFSGCYMGDYNALIAGQPGEFLLAWGDNRDGPPAAPDPNVYFDRVVVSEG